MTGTDLDTRGPVDFLVVEFPANTASFSGEIAERLVELVEAETIRVIDMLILVKDADGSIDTVELSDLEDLGPLAPLDSRLAELIAEDDVANLAAAMDPGSTAGVLVYENVWAVPFAAAVRNAGGQLIADGRIPVQSVVSSVEVDDLVTSGANCGRSRT